MSNTVKTRSSVSSSIILNTQSGYGSGGSFAVHYANVELNQGEDLELTQSSALGDVIRVGVAGKYCVSICAQTSAASNFGASVNTTSLGTFLTSLPMDQILMAEYTPASQEIEYSTTKVFSAGDLIRVHGDGAALTGSNFTRFRVTRVD